MTKEKLLFGMQLIGFVASIWFVVHALFFKQQAHESCHACIEKIIFYKAKADSLEHLLSKH
jgi:hypothetical protein